MTEINEEVLTTRQVAAELDITRSAVNSAIRDGRLTASVVVGKRRRCTRADVDAFLAAREERRRKATPRRSARQALLDNALYDLIVRYKQRTGGRSPTLSEMGLIMGGKSKSTILYRLRWLEADGRIVLEEDCKARSITIPGERWLAPGEVVTEEHNGR